MNGVQTKRTLRLRLLAFVLALALTWYSLNPVPGPHSRRKQEDEPPDEKKRRLEPHSLAVTLSAALRSDEVTVEHLQLSDEDDFEWPEFIDG
jgi:hypothetical protein